MKSGRADDMKIFRPATKHDLPRIAEIHGLAWREAYSGLISPEVFARMTPELRRSVWEKAFALEGQQIHVLQEGQVIVGFVRTCPALDRESPPDGFGELTHLYLHPSRIARGDGHRLFEHAKSVIEEGGHLGMLLWTLEGNRRARRFYESHGMVADGGRSDDPEWLGEGVYEVRYLLPFGA